MSETSKRKGHTKNTLEFFENIKPPSPDDLDKEGQLFPDDNSANQPSYLDLPIKVEGDLASFKPYTL